MPLYGQELSEERLPQEAGLPVVSYSKSQAFVGRDALEKAREAGLGKTSGRRLVGLKGAGKRAARAGSTVLDEAGNVIGEVTSGAPSPTLGHAIVLGYVDVAFKEPGTALQVDVRGKPQDVEVVELPFYRR